MKLPFRTRDEEAREFVLVSVSGPQLHLIDELLRDRRIRKTEPFISSGVSVLDVGCYNGSLFKAFSRRIARGVGIDPTLTHSFEAGRFRFVAEHFPSVLVGTERFDVITMLAVLEHVEPSELPDWRNACERLLVPGGILVLTVPSPLVDRILHVLRGVHLIAGMSTEQHHGFDPSHVPRLFEASRWRLETHRRFEFGLNHLFVFRLSAARGPQD